MAIAIGKAAFIELVNTLVVYGEDDVDETTCTIGPPVVFDISQVNDTDEYDYSEVNTVVTVTSQEISPFIGHKDIYYTRLDLNKIQSGSIVINFNNVGENFEPTLEQIVDAFNEASMLPIGYDEVNLRLFMNDLGSYEGGTLTSKPEAYTCIGEVYFLIVFDQQNNIQTAVYDGRMFNGY